MLLDEDGHRIASPTQIPSFPNENAVLDWDKSLPSTDIVLSTFSALPSSSDANGNDQRGGLDVEVEYSHDHLYYHTEQFLETLTTRDPTVFTDSSRTRSAIQLTCTFDGINFYPKRVRRNEQDDPSLSFSETLVRRALARAEASVSKDVIMSVSHDDEVAARTPQQFLKMHHLLNTLAKLADRPTSLAELAEIPEPRNLLGERLNEGDTQDVLNDLLNLGAEYKASIPQDNIDALPPAAFTKRPGSEPFPTQIPIIVVDEESVTPMTITDFAEIETPVGSGQGDHDFRSDHDMNEYMTQFKNVVEEATFNDGKGIDLFTGMEQASEVPIPFSNPTVDYLINDTPDDALTSLPSQGVADVQSWDGQLFDEQFFTETFAGPLPTETVVDDFQNFDDYSQNEPSLSMYTGGNVPHSQHAQHPEHSHHIPHSQTPTYANVNMNGWENSSYNLSLYNAHNTTWAQHRFHHSISQAIPQGGISHVAPALNMFQLQARYMPSTAVQLPHHFPSPQPPITNPSHPALPQPFQPLAHDPFPTQQTLQKRKRECDENQPLTDTSRPAKRQMLETIPSLSAPSTVPDSQVTLPTVDSLPLDDRRRQKPYKKGLEKEYICQYPVSETGTCGVIITLDKRGQGERNWQRHLRTHAKKEAKMLEDGLIDVNSEKICALLWVEPITVSCTEPDCGFSTKVWRTDGVLDEHLAKFHQARYLEKMERQRQKSRGNRKG
ncbi:hypothetical protein Clacol_004420 [Clathrus columnatus]|uniref:C2H2-type domain-containing protein n=1 Tax=Clathrus columnatus TaxID=1419009 RepID=A0AAV5ABV1_9AGAM|nr:hypothetical protein Clacol_004420 [Clathrus columnatus]